MKTYYATWFFSAIIGLIFKRKNIKETAISKEFKSYTFSSRHIFPYFIAMSCLPSHIFPVKPDGIQMKLLEQKWECDEYFDDTKMSKIAVK